jgi:CRP-like cAMP-binding protein
MQWTRARDAKIDRLRQLPVLRSCTDEEVRKLGAAGELVELPAGTVLQREGEDVDWLHLVIDGQISRSAGPEAVVGQTAVLAGEAAQDEVRADVALLVLVLGRREFRALMDAAPGFRSAVITSMAQTVASAAPHRATLDPPGVGQVYQLPIRPLVSAS